MDISGPTIHSTTTQPSISASESIVSLSYSSLPPNNEYIIPVPVESNGGSSSSISTSLPSSLPSHHLHSTTPTSNTITTHIHNNNPPPNTSTLYTDSSSLLATSNSSTLPTLSPYNSNNTHLPPSSSSTTSASSSSLSPEAVQSILYRIVKEPLSPEVVETYRSWLVKIHDPSFALQALNTLFDKFVTQSIAAKGPPSTISKAKDATLSFMNKLSGNSKGDYTVADFPDIRVSHVLLPLGPEHAHGERIPAPGAAASRPPPAVLFPVNSTGPISSSSSSSASSITNFPLPPSSNNKDLVPCPANTTLTCGLTLTNRGKPKAIVSVRPLQSFIQGDACLVSVEPATVVLDKGKSTVVHITLRLLRPCIMNDAFIVIEVAGGNRILVLARAYCERTVFGMRLQDVPVISNAGYDNIPVPLALLRDRLVADGGTTLKLEGIFRVAPSNEEKNSIRKTLNEGTFTLTHPPISGIAIAHMIKVFLRELPQPLFSAIPTETLLNAMNEEDCISLIGWLTPPSSVIFAWLVDLLIEVIKYEQYNKMGAKNLAICTGPNLFVTDESVNPMEALMTSQKAVSALYQIINARALGEQNNRDIFSEYLGIAVRKRILTNNNNNNVVPVTTMTISDPKKDTVSDNKDDSTMGTAIPARSSINALPTNTINNHSNRSGIRLSKGDSLETANLGTTTSPITAANTISNDGENQPSILSDSSVLQ